MTDRMAHIRTLASLAEVDGFVAAAREFAPLTPEEAEAVGNRRHMLMQKELRK